MTKDVEAVAVVEKDYKDPPPSPLFDAKELTKWSFYRALIAEFVATLLFLYITVLTVIGYKSQSATDDCAGVGILGIAWAFGGMIFVLVYCTAGVSGGHINPAVTFGLLLARKLSVIRAILYMVAQCLGAICGVGFVKAFQSGLYDRFGGGANELSDGYSKGTGLGAEIIGTFVLVYTVFSATALGAYLTVPQLILAPSLFNSPPITRVEYLPLLLTHKSMDFDIDDSFHPITVNKRKNVIGLDDLFNDHKKEQETNKKKKSKASKAVKNCESDDDDTLETETKLTETFQNFQQTMKEVDGQEIQLTEHHNKDLTSSWGLEVFGAQRTSSSSLVIELGSSLLLQNHLDDEVSVLMEHSEQMGESFLRGLLLNGWLSKLIINRGYLEESIAKWALNLSLYSPEESVMTSSCDFWCTVLLCDEVHTRTIKIEWLPNYVELKEALGSFGFQLYSLYNMLPAVQSSESSEQESSKSTGLHFKGPPANIRAWIKLAGACCRVRSRYLIFSALEAQELVATIVCLFLERNLSGLSSELHDCLGFAIHYFEEKEWGSSCEKVTQTIAVRVPRDLNCLRAVECISGVDTRSKQLRSVLAFQMLKSCFTEMSDTNDVLKFLLSKNLKDKSCDLFKIYIYFVLAENWLLFSAELGPIDQELWNGVIRKCSSQIYNTDFRPCAQEIRNRASYLMQNTSKE